MVGVDHLGDAGFEGGRGLGDGFLELGDRLDRDQVHGQAAAVGEEVQPLPLRDQQRALALDDVFGRDLALDDGLDLKPLLPGFRLDQPDLADQAVRGIAEREPPSVVGDKAAVLDRRVVLAVVVAGVDLFLVAAHHVVGREALTAAAEARDNAEGILRDAYQREADAINARADQFRDLADGLRKFEESLRPNLGGRGGYGAARSAFERTSALAATGDVKALGALQGVSEAYLAAARSVAPDARAYARDLAAVRNAVQSSASAAEAQVTQAEAQLAALREQVGALIKIDATLATVAEAIGGFSSAVFTLAVEQGRATQTPEERAGGVAPPPAPATPTVASDPRTAAAIERQNELLAEQNALLAEIAKSGGTTANVLQRSTRDGEGFVIAAA